MDFNPTVFSHPKAEGVTLSNEGSQVRRFWIDHCKVCVRISQYFAEELGNPYAMNIWIPDDFKDTPTDRTSPRTKPKSSLNQTLAMDYDKSKVFIAVESKMFGVGMESCTVGSHELYVNYAVPRGITCLLDSGHFHLTEAISDKILSMLLFLDKITPHVGRPVRWDGDRVVLFDDEIRETAKEIVRSSPDRAFPILDFFGTNANHICAWVTGVRNMQKALSYAPLILNEKLAKPQKERGLMRFIVEQEGFKTYPFGDVWDYFRQMNQVPAKGQWLKEVQVYEREVLLKRS